MIGRRVLNYEFVAIDTYSDSYNNVYSFINVYHAYGGRGQHQLKNESVQLHRLEGLSTVGIILHYNRDFVVNGPKLRGLAHVGWALKFSHSSSWPLLNSPVPMHIRQILYS